MATSDRASLKARAQRVIDVNASHLEEIGRAVFAAPELGFKEWKTARLVVDWLERLGIPYQAGVARTGVVGELRGGHEGPTIAVLGELDSLLCWEHPDRDRSTGAVHACGHNAQIAMLIGVAAALREVRDDLWGRVLLIAVPAEEYVELDERLALRAANEVEFLGGKAEMVRLGVFDDVEAAMMVHTSAYATDGLLAVGGTSNGLVAKVVRFLGRAAHAGGAPERGVNALYAAHVALAGVNALRETFRDADHVRVHPILTRGGDVVNAIPAEARLEMFCRAATPDAIEHVSRQVDRALLAGALALGCDVEITTMPGYLPLRQDATLQEIYRPNAEAIVGPENVTVRGHNTSSTDMGDLSQILPVLHPYARGAEGTSHGADYRVVDYALAAVNPAKAIAMTAIDLLVDGAAETRRVAAAFQPSMSRSEYVAYLRRLSVERRWNAAEIRACLGLP